MPHSFQYVTLYRGDQKKKIDDTVIHLRRNDWCEKGIKRINEEETLIKNFNIFLNLKPRSNFLAIDK